MSTPEFITDPTIPSRVIRKLTNAPLQVGDRVMVRSGTYRGEVGTLQDINGITYEVRLTDGYGAYLEYYIRHDLELA